MDKFIDRLMASLFGFRVDRKNYTLFVVIMTLAATVLVIGSIALWLFVFNYVMSNADMSQLTTLLAILGIAAIVVSLLVALGTPVDDYTFGKACKVSYCAAFVVLTLLFWIITLSFTSASGTLTFTLGLLLVILGIPAGAALGLLPSLLGSAVGWIARQIILIINDR